MWVDSTKSYKTTCNNSDASIRFEVSCKFEKTHQKVDQQCPMKEMYLKLRIKRRFKQKHLVRMPLGYPGFIVFSHGLITSISNTFHAGPASSCVSGIDLRVPKVISQQNQVPMLWASNNFLSILIGARLCMKHAKCFLMSWWAHQQGLLRKDSPNSSLRYHSRPVVRKYMQLA